MSFKDLTTHIDTKLEYTNQADFIKQNKVNKSGRPKKEDREKRKHKRENIKLLSILPMRKCKVLKRRFQAIIFRYM